MVAAPNLTPDFSIIEAHLRHITRRWDELGQPVMMEIVALSDEDVAGFKSVAHFKIDAESIAEAAEHAAEINQYRQNVYVTVNPLDAENMPRVGKRAKAENIVASFFHWADADSEEAADNIKSTVGPKSTFVVLTGSTPFPRPHVYWELEEPTRNLEAWSQTQRNIAARLKTDKVVVDPPRIMRLAGSINWPKPQKKAKGYVPELTQLHIHDPEERPVVTSEAMARAFPGGPTSSSAPQDGPLRIDTATHSGPSVEDQLDKIRRAQTDGEKHGGVRDLTASLAAQGVNRSTVEAIIRAVCPVWDDGVVALIDSAFEKFWQEKKAPVAATPEAITGFNIETSSQFLSDLQPLEYLIDGILPKGVAYSITGHAGHGKTTLALQVALAISQGEDFAERTTSRGSVLILAGENPYNVKWQYAAALAARTLRPEDVDIHFVPGRFSIDQWIDVLRAKLEAMSNLKLIIVDSLQAFFEGDNDNDNSQMVAMAHKLRGMCQVRQKPTILIIAHPAGKTPSRDNLVPRGGGAFLNEIDGNLTVWSADGSQQTLHHSQKFRGASFEPVEFVMQVREFDHLTDINGTPLKLPVSRPEMTLERVNREKNSDEFLRQWLYTVEAEAPLSEREAASKFRMSRHRVRQIIETATAEKLVKRYAKTWRITEGGKEFLEGKNAGE